MASEVHYPMVSVGIDVSTTTAGDKDPATRYSAVFYGRYHHTKHFIGYFIVCAWADLVVARMANDSRELGWLTTLRLAISFAPSAQ